MSNDLPAGDRAEGQGESWREPPECPGCRAAGLGSQPLLSQDGRWWCRRCQSFVELEG